MTLISETVASSISSLDFTGISGSHKQLLLIWTGIIHSTGGSGFGIRFNSDSGSNYSSFGIRFQDSTASNFGGDDTSITPTGSGLFYPYGFGIDTSTNKNSTGKLLIDNYASTTKQKYYTGSWNFTESFVAARTVGVLEGTYLSTSAITSINIFRAGGSATFSNLANTTIRLYGVS